MILVSLAGLGSRYAPGFLTPRRPSCKMSSIIQYGHGSKALASLYVTIVVKVYNSLQLIHYQ